MKTYAFLSLLMVSLVLASSCQKESSLPVLNAALVGEWRYVGLFDHRADYKCFVCPAFDYEKSLYRFTLQENGRFNARVNLMIAEGQYLATAKTHGQNLLSGSFEINQLTFLNRPFETPADAEFIRNFQSVTLFYFNSNTNSQYDELHLSFGENSYYIFVRKK
jgi:hypothetical protein